jgi:hypothetical protein
VDEPNRLHFYILDKFVNADGILSYQVGVRSLDGSKGQKQGVTAKFVNTSAFSGWNLRITNTGKQEDIYRISISGGTSSAVLTNELIAIPFGESRDVKLYIDGEGINKSKLSVRVTSESNPAVSTSATSSL